VRYIMLQKISWLAFTTTPPRSLLRFSNLCSGTLDRECRVGD
jgi:hypothetical protein